MIARDSAVLLGQLGVMHQHVELTVDRHVVGWVQGGDKLHVVVVVAMAR